MDVPQTVQGPVVAAPVVEKQTGKAVQVPQRHGSKTKNHQAGTRPSTPMK